MPASGSGSEEARWQSYKGGSESLCQNGIELECPYGHSRGGFGPRSLLDASFNMKA